MISRGGLRTVLGISLLCLFVVFGLSIVAGTGSADLAASSVTHDAEFVPDAVQNPDSTVAADDSVSGNEANESSGADGTIQFDLDGVNTTGNTTVFLRLGDSNGMLTVDDNDTIDPENRKDDVAEIQEPVVSYLDSLEHVSVERTFWISNAIVVTIDADRVDVESVLRSAPNVDRVHPNYNVTLDSSTATTVDPHAPASNHLPTSPYSTLVMSTVMADGNAVTPGVAMTDAPTVWNRTRGSDVRIAVLDTGIDVDHPDLQLRTDDPDDPTYPGGWAEYDPLGLPVDSEPHDTDGHGTHVSGTVAGGNASGTSIGVAPDVELMHGLVFRDGSATMSSVLAGMEWAVENDADVVSMSLGIEPDGQSVYESGFIEPIENARASGTVVVASSGNAGENITTSPGNLYSDLSIGAVDEDRSVAGFSGGEMVPTDEAWGNDAPDDWPDEYAVPDVVAHGVDVESADDGGGYRSASGTSMAAPHVAGALGLLLSDQPELSVEEAESLLRSTAIHPDGYTTTADHRYGTGVINAHSALVAAEHDTWIEGVATFDAEPADRVRIESDTRTWIVTATDGTFALPVEPGERTLSVDTDQFGTVTQSVSATEGERTEVTMDLDRSVSARILQDQPETLVAGESATLVFDVEHLDGYAVSPTSDSDIHEDEVTLIVGGEAVTPGETVPFDRYSGNLSVEFIVDEAAEGVLELEHTFVGAPENVSHTTGPTSINQPDSSAFSIQEFRVSERIPATGLPLIEVTVVNEDDRSRIPAIEWSSDGESWKQLGSETTLDPGDNVTVRERLEHDFEPGLLEHHISVTDPDIENPEGIATETTELLDADGGIDVVDVNHTVRTHSNQSVEATITVENVANTSLNDLVWASIDDVYDADRTVLGPNETATVTLSGAVPDQGRYHHTSGTSTNTNDDPLYVDLHDYVDDDGRVGARQLGNGAASFRRSDVSAQFLGDLASAFRSGDQLRIR